MKPPQWRSQAPERRFRNVLALRAGSIDICDGRGGILEAPETHTESPKEIEVGLYRLQLVLGHHKNGCVGEVSVAVGLHEPAAPIREFDLKCTHRRVGTGKIERPCPARRVTLPTQNQKVCDAVPVDGDLANEERPVARRARMYPDEPFEVGVREEISELGFGLPAPLAGGPEVLRRMEEVTGMK